MVCTLMLCGPLHSKVTNFTTVVTTTLMVGERLIEVRLQPKARSIAVQVLIFRIVYTIV